MASMSVNMNWPSLPVVVLVPVFTMLTCTPESGLVVPDSVTMPCMLPV